MSVRRPATAAVLPASTLRFALSAGLATMGLVLAASMASAQPTTARMTQGAPTRDGGTSTLKPSGTINGRHVATSGHSHAHRHTAPARAPGPNNNT